ncbi:MAG TPA: glycerol-3-phosphate 1-O-acyltransferase PlsY [Elusimicrobiota bacterium]|nr:glycerol-3-phosphate 1-O-acyltransferase PlsY [Elusimicrobiota bacterium]
MTPLSYLGALGGSYLIGSFPTGYLMGRWWRGIDIREHGSGNPGATNVFRVVGKGPGLITLAIDIAKGIVAVWLVQVLFGGSDVLKVMAGCCAVVGHTWTPFLRFKGGKGVATSAGVFVTLLPIPAAIAIAGFAVAFAATRHVSVGSLTGSILLPLTAWMQCGGFLFSEGSGHPLKAAMATALAVLIILKHIPNIKRLIKGEELALTTGSDKKHD